VIDSTAALFLRSVRAENFRCFNQLRLDLPPGLTVFLGANAQGKTSILEAICVLLRLQSPRTSTASELARFDHDGYGLAGELVSPAADDAQRLMLRVDRGIRQLTLDGENCGRSHDYLRHGGLLVWMGNDDLELVRGSSERRRRYLDFLGSQAFPEYRIALSAYDKALRSRNRLLKMHPRTDERQLLAYTQLLVQHGTQLMHWRGQVIEHISPWAAQSHDDISGQSQEPLQLVYQPGATAHFEAALKTSRAQEEARRVTVVGPHRDDVSLLLRGRPAASFASEGQQRTLALALKLAQARWLQHLTQISPILLIDDVFGELDKTRRQALLSFLPPASQKLITTTHLDWADHSFCPSAHFRVIDGQVSADSSL
jgi:DNA replication and repair protein RecF